MQRQSVIKLALTTLLAFYGIAVSADQVPLAENGNALAVIVLPDAPGDTEELAASELQSYLEKITGAKLPVLAESERGDEPFLSVGRTRLAAEARERLAGKPADAFVVESVPGGIVLAGGGESGRSAGTLFAVYDFLEQDLGCRWLGPGELWEHVPGIATLAVTPADRLETPAFRYRRGKSGARDPHLWSFKHKANMIRPRLPFDWAMQNGDPPEFDTFGYPDWHSLGRLLPMAGRRTRANPERLKTHLRVHSEHPEWFPLQPDGVRRPGFSCHSNPEMLDLLADRMSQILREYPNMDYVQLGDGDGYSRRACQCGTCLDRHTAGAAAHETSRGLNSYDWRLWENTIAAILAETDPDKKLMGTAYASAQEPLDPEISPADNVMMELTSWSQCRAHGLEHEYEDETRLPEALSHADSRDWIERWGAQTPAGVSYMEYIGRNSMQLITAPIPRRFVYDVRYLRRNNALGYRAGGGPSPFGFYLINTYAARKAAWNPDIDPDELVRDFCDHAFHEGSEHMQAFINVIEEAVHKSNCDHCRLVAWTIDEERMAEAHRHMDAAREAVADNEAALRRLITWYHHFNYAALAGPALHNQVGVLHNVYGVERDVNILRGVLEGLQAAVDYAEAARAELIEKYGSNILNVADVRRFRHLGRRGIVRQLQENSRLRQMLAELEAED